jgi:hypothetical protein
MATISRTGITAGGTISPTHITNIIDALDGTGVGITVVATGSFTGSLIGNATTATTASYVLQAVSASFATTATSASFATTATTSSYLIGVGANNITITGSLNNSTLITATSGSIINLSGMTGDGGTFPGKLILPSGRPSSPAAGAIYWDDGAGQLYIYSAADTEWKLINP